MLGYWVAWSYASTVQCRGPKDCFVSVFPGLWPLQFSTSSSLMVPEPERVGDKNVSIMAEHSTNAYSSLYLSQLWNSVLYIVRCTNRTNKTTTTPFSDEVWEWLKSNQKLIGYPHLIHYTIVPMGVSGHTGPYCSSQNWKLGKTNGYFLLQHPSQYPLVLGELAGRDEALG